MPPPTATFAWHSAAASLFRKRFPSRIERNASSAPPMCALRRIADVARQAARRSLTTSSTSPSVLASLLSRTQKLAPYLSESELENIVSLVGNVSASDLGLLRQEFSGNGPEITFIPVAETPDVSMAVFVLPPGTAIPLHDHVGMFVVSRVLWGRLEVREYDVLTTKWTGHNAVSKGRVAVRRPPSFTDEGEVRTLSPSRGNIHSFHAQEWTAVFDVLLPPYDAENGRECRYYSAIPFDEGKAPTTMNGKSNQDKVFLQVCRHHCVSFFYGFNERNLKKTFF